MQNRTDIKTLTAKAKALFRKVSEVDASIYGTLDHGLYINWQFGILLNQLKAKTGHGNWLAWRRDTFPKLDDNKAERCQRLNRDNPNASTLGDLNKDSIRKFRYGYIPIKDRPKQKGDGKFPRPSHHSSVVNECNKLMQRVKSGQYQPNEKELLRDFRPFFEWLSLLYGG